MRLQAKREALQRAIQICLDRSFELAWPHPGQVVLCVIGRRMQDRAAPGDVDVYGLVRVLDAVARGSGLVNKRVDGGELRAEAKRLIREMGWRFTTARGLAHLGYLTQRKAEV